VIVAADPSIVRFRAVVEGALVHLESRRQEINDLNVFPVADGDTGDNMALTLRAVIEELDRLANDDERLLDEIGRDELVASVARAALLGARGNSGVILSQLVRGAAEELISRPGELIDPTLVGAAVAQAAQRAYSSVREPVEGTMLTVMRDMAAALSHHLAHSEGRLDADADPARQNALIADALEHAVIAGEASVRRTPELLPALRDAGVVDAGGYAVTIIFAGVVAALRGTEAPVLAHYAKPLHSAAAGGDHASETYRFCTNFAVTGTGLDQRDWAADLAEIGDSLMVVGDDRTLKIHVHTDDPERATALFAEAGAVSHLDVADMHLQVDARAARLASEEHRTCGALAVTSGAGMAELFHGLGAATLDGGPTLNPSTTEIVAAIEAVPADAVVVLANSANVVMAAERAAELAARSVHVLRTTSQQAGLAAVVALLPDQALEHNVAALEEVLAGVRTGGVAPAARDDPAGRFAVGDAVGFVEDELIAWGEPRPTVAAVIAALADGAELVSCIGGADAPLADGDLATLAPADVEFELSHGGQPAWWWLLAAE